MGNSSSRPLNGFDVFNTVVLICVVVVLMFMALECAKGGYDKPIRTVQLSCTKQVAQALDIYTSAFDDDYPALGQWQGENYRTWAQALHPYVKAPLYYVPGEPESGSWQDTDEVTGAMGLNYSAVNRTEGGRLVSRTLSELVFHPETTVLIGPRVSKAHFDRRVILQHGPTRTLYLMNIEPPVASAHNSVSVGAWGTDFWIARDLLSASRIEGSQGLLRGIRSGRSDSLASNFCMAFVDSHAKCMPISALAAGTDCIDAKPDAPLLHSCRITDPTKYLWGD